MKQRVPHLLFLITVVVTFAFPVARGTTVEIIRAELREAQAEAEAAPKPDTAKPVTTADRVFSVPERETRIALALADLVTGARLNPVAPQVKSMKTEDDASVWAARTNLDTAVGLLTKLDDPRAVRMIAPLLAEKELLISNGAKTSTPAQECAAFALRELALHGVIDLGDPKSHAGLEKLRAWWNENHDHYGPIPAPLLAIDQRRLPPELPQAASPTSVAAETELVRPNPERVPRWNWKLPMLMTFAILFAVAAMELVRKRKPKDD
jgi:hypothetical protein